MSPSVHTLSPDSTLQDAVLLQMRAKLRHIPIVDGTMLVGMVTDRDLKRAMPSVLSGTDRAEYERVMSTTKVGQIMTRSPLTIEPETPLIDALRIVCEKRFGALPVVENGALVGILTQTDLLRAFLAALERTKG